MLHDLRFAVRLIVRKPLFSLVVVAVLALGIGANTAIFTLVNGVMIRQLEYPDPRQLFRLFHRDLSGRYSRGAVTPGNFTDWKNQTDSWEAMATVRFRWATLTGLGEPRRLQGAESAGNILEVLGVAPAEGRLLSDADDEPGADPVVVISHRMWQQVLEGAGDVIGRSLNVGGETRTVVGVMPPGFGFPTRSTMFWIPAQWSEEFRYNRFEFGMQVVGRLKTSVTAETAAAELETVMFRLRAEYPTENQDVGANIVPLHDQLVSGAASTLYLLMGAVAFVLLIACVNLANLFLARSTSRQSEYALRNALGAGRRRLLGQSFCESILLGLAGAVLGIFAGWGLMRIVVNTVASQLPRINAIVIDWRVVAFTAAIGIGCSVIFGLFPALHTLRAAPADILRSGVRSTLNSRRTRGWMVMAEVALALVLLVGAGLLIRSLLRIQDVDPGFDPDNLLSFSVSLPPTRYDADNSSRFYREASEQLTALPGIRSAAAITSLPVTGTMNSAWFNVVGRPAPDGRTPPSVLYRIATPEYFETIGIGLQRGRLPEWTDSREGSPAVVVNQALVETHFPDEDPLGSHIVLGPLEEEVIHPPARIVGVVANVKNIGLAAGERPLVYLPHPVAPQWTSLTFVVRTELAASRVMPLVRSEMRRLDADIPVYAVATMSEVIDSTLSARQSVLWLIAIFAAAALVMAAIGVFGVLSYNVSQRTRELGIRMALGADGQQLFSLVLREGLALTVAGIGLGLLASLGLTRVLASQLYQVSPLDPLTLAAVAAVLVTAALAASVIPARRASRTPALEALRRD